MVKKYIAIVAIAVVAIAALFMFAFGVFNNVVISPIQISGKATTLTPTTKALSVTFTDLNTKQSFNAVVSTERYSLTVPNQSWQFSTQIHWQGLAGVTGDCIAQPIAINSGSTFFVNHDVSC